MPRASPRTAPRRQGTGMVVKNRNRPVGHRARAMAWHSSPPKAFAIADAMTRDKRTHTINVMAWFVKESVRKGCQFRWRAWMPTLSKAQLVEPESPWGAAFDRMYLELCQNRIPILMALGFTPNATCHRRRIQMRSQRKTKKRSYVK